MVCKLLNWENFDPKERTYSEYNAIQTDLLRYARDNMIYVAGNFIRDVHGKKAR